MSSFVWRKERNDFRCLTQYIAFAESGVDQACIDVHDDGLVAARYRDRHPEGRGAINATNNLPDLPLDELTLYIETLAGLT